MFKLFLALFFCINLYANNLSPKYSFVAKGNVTDFVVKNGEIYIATDASVVEVFDLNSANKKFEITLPKIKDFTSMQIDSKIYSIDIVDDKLLILSQGEDGGRDIFIYANGKLSNIISAKNRLFIANAKFLSKDKIIYALLSNQIFIYDLTKQKTIFENHISLSSFSHFKLNEDKSKLLVADESGIITMLNTTNLEKLATYEGQNVDRVFQVDIKKDTILTAGQDRRVAIYNTKSKKAYYKSFDFLIYSGAISPSSKLACVAFDEDNNALVFDISSQKELFILTNNRAIITKIEFLNEDTIVISSDDNLVNLYNLK